MTLLGFDGVGLADRRWLLVLPGAELVEHVRPESFTPLERPPGRHEAVTSCGWRTRRLGVPSTPFPLAENGHDHDD